MAETTYFPRRLILAGAMVCGVLLALGYRDKLAAAVAELIAESAEAEWLEEQIDKGKLTHKAPGGRKNYLDMTPAQCKLDGLRDKYLDKFAQRAARGNDEYGYGGTVDDFDDGIDGVDSDVVRMIVTTRSRGMQSVLIW